MPSFVSDYILKRNTIFILGDCKLAGNQPFQNKLRVRLPTIKWEVGGLNYWEFFKSAFCFVFVNSFHIFIKGKFIFFSFISTNFVVLSWIFVGYSCLVSIF